MGTGEQSSPAQHSTTTGNTGFDEGLIQGLIEDWSSVWVGRCAEKDAVVVVGAVTQESKPAGRRASGTPLSGQEAMLWLVIPWGWHSAFSPTPPISCRAVCNSVHARHDGGALAAHVGDQERH